MNDEYYDDLDITSEDDIDLDDDYFDDEYDEQELSSFDTEDVRDKEELTREFDRETDRQRHIRDIDEQMDQQAEDLDRSGSHEPDKAREENPVFTHITSEKPPEGFRGFGESVDHISEPPLEEEKEQPRKEPRRYVRLDGKTNKMIPGKVPDYSDYEGNPGPYLGQKLNLKKSTGNPDDDEPAEGFRGFLFDQSLESVLKRALLIFVAVFYIGLLMTQNLSANSFFNQSTGEFQGPTFTFNPITIAMNIPAAITFLVFLISLFAGGWYYYCRNLKGKGGKIGQTFNLSDKGTYGTASLATDRMIRDKVVFSTRNRPEGLPCGISMETGKSVCLPPWPQSNKNMAVFGASGSGKSWGFVRPAIITCIDRRTSFVVTDPSGELYRDTAKLAKAAGMKVRVLNLKDFAASDGWNPLDELRMTPRDEVQTRIDTFAATIMKNAAEDDTKRNAFFDDAELGLLKALIAYVAVSPGFIGEEHERHLGTLYDIMFSMTQNGGLMPAISELDPKDPARANWGFYENAEKLKTNYLQGLSGKLQALQNDALKEVLSHNEMDLRSLGKEPCAYYVIPSVANDAYKFVMSLFFSCAFEELITEAEQNISGKLDVPVYFLFDEFKSIGTISGFSDKLANVRKYDISISMIFQDPGQIEYNYPKQSDSILSNCDHWLVLGVNDMKTAKFISDRCGEATIRNESLAETHSKYAPVQMIPEQRVSIADGKRMVLTPDEVYRMPSDEAIIICRTKNAYICKKYGWPNHYFAEYIDNPVNKTHPSSHVPEWQNEEKTMDKPRTFLTYVGKETAENSGTDNGTGSWNNYQGNKQEEQPKKKRNQSREREEDPNLFRMPDNK